MDYIIPAFSMLALDGLYLSNIGGPLFAKMVKGIQKEEMTLNMYGVVGSYILLVLVLYKFIILERKSPTDAFILGLCVYGVFDFTNIAIFKNYIFIRIVFFKFFFNFFINIIFFVLAFPIAPILS